jgi:NitT/TauT family transport system ATP-binding protein
MPDIESATMATPDSEAPRPTRGQTVIALHDVTKRFPTRSGDYTAITNVNLTIAPGEFVALVGPTGCGKSTTLGLISGLLTPSEGEVVVNGYPVRGIQPGLGYMFQTDAVMPWRNVLDNIGAGLRYHGASRREARAEAQTWVSRVGLNGFEHHHPHQLSGGMRKRVSLAQTLINEPTTLLMDEPFGALDVQTRGLMQDMLLGLWSGSGASVVFVTHDITEAVALADRVVVMTAGPATVKDEIAVNLERPRRVEEIRLTAEFLTIYRRVWDSLREEVEITRAKAATGATRVH